MTAPCSPRLDPSASAGALVAASHESSLFAIHALAQSLAERPEPHARLALTIPSSASGVISMTGPLGLPSHLLAPAQPPTVAPIAASRGAWWMFGALTVAVVGLALAVVTATPRTVIVRSPTASSPTAGSVVASGAMAPAHPEPSAALEHNGASDSTSDDPLPSPDAAEQAAQDATTVAAKPAAKPAARTKPKPTALSSRTTTPAVAPPQAIPTSGALPSVECVLDPTRCSTPPKTTGSAASPSAGADSGAALPAKLTAAQLRDGLAAAKPAAKQCGRTHGVASGTEIKVKLSIAGSGTVRSATVQGESVGTALETCLASAAKGASFPAFGDAVMGALYTFRL